MSPTRRPRHVVAILGILCTCLAPPAAGPVDRSDAERMASLLETTAYRPSASELQGRYLDPGSSLLAEFTAERAGGLEGLAAASVALRADYRRAVARCLPAARALAPRVPELLAELGRFLDVGSSPAVQVLFGAGRSAGTVIDGTVVLALEVICRFDDGRSSPEALLEGFLLHEAVHVHQLARQEPGAEDSLLRQAMIEGFADFVTGRMLGRVPAQEAQRHRYGLVHEAALWTAFRDDMHGTSLGRWMYGPGPDGAPPDLGYWIGKRICAAYADQGAAEDAIRALLALESPRKLLDASGYPETLVQVPAAPAGPGVGTGGR